MCWLHSVGPPLIAWPAPPYSPAGYPWFPRAPHPVPQSQIPQTQMPQTTNDEATFVEAKFGKAILSKANVAIR